MVERQPILISSEQVKVQRLALQRRIGWLIMAVTAIGVALSFTGSALFAGLAFWLGMVTFVIGAMTTAMARRDPGTIAGLASHAEPGVVELKEGQLRVAYGSTSRDFALDELQDGWIEEGEHIDTLVLSTTRGEAILSRLHVSQRDDAQRLLRNLGLDERAVKMWIGSSTRGGRGCASGCLFFALLMGIPAVIAFVIALAYSLVGEGSWALIGSIAPFTAVFVAVAIASGLALRSAEVTIGSDGIFVRSSPWNKRFIAFTDLSDHYSLNDKLVIETAGPKPLKIRCQNTKGAIALDERIAKAKARFDEGSSLDLRELDRGARPFSEWRERLLGLLDSAKAYRDRALSRDDLWAVVQNAAATPERRVGAALALSKQVDDEGRDRIRVAAEGCANEPLRVAIDNAADGELEEAALEEAMTAYSASHARTRG